MNSRSDDLRQRKNAVKIDSDPVQILDETEQQQVIDDLSKLAESSSYYWNKLSSLLLVVCAIYYTISDLPLLPPLKPLIAKAITLVSCLASAFLSFSPTFIPFATSHLESGGPVFLMGFLALTSPRLEWKDKVIWLIPSLTVGFAYLARSESDSLQRQVGELKNKLYRSPTA